jgi:predicted acylesterase/phospholipase RssA
MTYRTVQPDYIAHYDESEDPLMFSGVPYEKSAQPIEGICFGGVGAKGQVYAGVLDALEDKDIIVNLNRLCGSSAGAVVATLLGTFAGLKNDTIRRDRLKQLIKVITGTDFGMFLVDPQEPKKVSLLDVGLNIIGRLLMYHFISPLAIPVGTTTMLLNRIFDKSPPTRGQLPNRSASGTRGETFLWWIRNTLYEFLGLPPFDPKKPMKVTFEDYYAMTGLNLIIVATKVDGDPSRQKVDQTPQKVYFNHITTPNVEVALAVRASVSLEGVFDSVEIDGHNYIDGGYYDLSYFDVHDTEGNLRAWDTKTIGFSLKDHNEDRLIPTGIKDGSPFWLRTCGIDTFASISDSVQLSRELDLAITPEPITISITEFALNENKKAIMSRKSYNQTMDFLNWIQSRMETNQKRFPDRCFLLSPKYREKIFLPAMVSALNNDEDFNIDELMNQFFCTPEQVGLHATFDGMDQTDLLYQIEKYETTIAEVDNKSQLPEQFSTIKQQS